ncbi:hypothetical protein [Leucothrix arctica]|uniref:Orn/DAP/Arg decarboxylase 2 C-terminal domain-containing protein n=1 Tax=Leucothrix arctica TaxID=1481894 RepID=A0A317CIN5_9GAMM|nr:hypothetical protein [Leucothrix arctica]PWQ98425.1 hypothetical protein DKT75_04690 [Leucothrix arctica]
MLVTRVIYVKAAEPRSFVILDAAMNDLMRPALYEAVQLMLEIKDNRKVKTQQCDIVGPIFESTDTFARNYSVSSEIAFGDLVAFFFVGAYGAVMSNSYNSRDIIPDVLVKEGEFEIIRQRIDQSVLRGLKDLVLITKPCVMA